MEYKLSNFQNNGISVVGSTGSAIGDNNRVTVIKNTQHVHHHGSTKKSDEDAASIAIGIGLLGVFALAAISYFFALHAGAMYGGIRVIVAAELGISVVAAMMNAWRYDELPTGKAWITLLALTVATIGLQAAHHSYSDDLTRIASQMKGPIDFWCHLSNYGRQIALLHGITAPLGFGFGALILAAPSVAPLLESAFDIQLEDSRASSWVVVIFGLVLVLIASYFHTEMGTATWLDFVQKPSAQFCLK